MTYYYAIETIGDQEYRIAPTEEVSCSCILSDDMKMDPVFGLHFTSLFTALRHIGYPMKTYRKLQIKPHKDDEQGIAVTRAVKRWDALSMFEKGERSAWSLAIWKRLEEIGARGLVDEKRFSMSLAPGVAYLPMDAFMLYLAAMDNEERRVITGFVQRILNKAGMN